MHLHLVSLNVIFTWLWRSSNLPFGYELNRRKFQCARTCHNEFGFERGSVKTPFRAQIQRAMRIDSRPLLPSLLAMACGTTSSVASSKHHYNLRISHQCSHLPYFNVVLSSSQRRGKIRCKIKDNFPFQFVQALDNRGV